MTTFVLAVLLVWVACAPFAYALTLGKFQRKFPDIAERCYREDQVIAVWVGLFGPFGLLSAICTGALRYGLKWK